MKKVFWTLLLSAFVFIGMVNAQEKHIKGIEVQGNHTISEKVILFPVTSKVGDKFSQDSVAADVKAIYSLGYFKNVESAVEPYGVGVKVFFKVVENPTISSIQVDGNIAVSTREIFSLITLKEGTVLDYKKVRDDIASINDLYKTQGYTLAHVIDVELDQKSGEVDYLIQEGIIESVTLEGNDSTQAQVILREMTLKPGAVFNEKILSKDLRNIFNLGYFSEVTPQFTPGSSPDKLNMILMIKETRSNTINFGGGYGEREGWFGFTDLAFNNLAGTGQAILLKGQAGQQLTTYQFKYSNPWFIPDKLGDRTSFTFRIWNTMGTDIYLTQQDEWHVGWDVALGKKLKDEWLASYSLGSESVAPLSGASFEAYASDWIGVSLSYDNRDNWMNPSSGSFHTFSLKEGWKYASLISTYTKVAADFNTFVPTGISQVLAAHLGFGIGFGDVPLGELYWAGGPNTVRGYGLNDMRKGKKKVIGNLEYRYSFNESLQAVVFFDWGNAWDTGAPVPSDFLTGWGPGVRLNTPMGPIRLDYGIPGAVGYPGAILHFTIGQAF